MKPISWFDYHFSGWLWLIRYKIANFIIGYNIEDALEEHMAEGWDEGHATALRYAAYFGEHVPNPYRCGETSE